MTNILFGYDIDCVEPLYINFDKPKNLVVIGENHRRAIIECLNNSLILSNIPTKPEYKNLNLNDNNVFNNILITSRTNNISLYVSDLKINLISVNILRQTNYVLFKNKDENEIFEFVKHYFLEFYPNNNDEELKELIYDLVKSLKSDLKVHLLFDMDNKKWFRIKLVENIIR